MVLVHRLITVQRQLLQRSVCIAICAIMLWLGQSVMTAAASELSHNSENYLRSRISSRRKKNWCIFKAHLACSALIEIMKL